jgi:hypothetical protein
MIDVTNACHHACSNCTRFCGEHPKPFFMEVDFFKKAVDSLVDFPGIVGIIGGEPSLHPDFEEMMDYYAAKIPEPRPAAFIGTPTPSFKDYGRTVRYMRGRKRGLFSALGPGYYKNFETIQDVFAYQSLNDHQSVNMHQAILVTRKELGIPDEEWFKLRDNCWIQNIWSATITPKGAFFCEIAASLDMLFDGPGGWPVEPGWWKRKPFEFGEQLNWCESCSVALTMPANSANDECDIVSPVMLERLKKVNGPKIRKNQFVILDTNNYDPKKYEGHKPDPIWYLPEDKGDEARISSVNTVLLPHRVDVAVREGSSEKVTLTTEAAVALEFKDWIALFRDGAAVNAEFLESVGRCVLNPGCIYSYRDEVLLFNRRARALRGAERLSLSEDFRLIWEKKKRISLKNYPRIETMTAMERITIRTKQIGQRASFLLPA